MTLRLRLAGALLLVTSLMTGVFIASAQHPDYEPFVYDEFQEVWDRTDRPVLEGAAVRTWIWGPGANSPLMQEEYDGDDRDVQYTDKSRMELPIGVNVDPDSEWFITQGLLATELMTGQLQLGDEEFQLHLPASIPVAGDPDDLTGPTYETLGMHIDRDPREAGGAIIEVIDRDGEITEDEDLAEYAVTDEYQIEDVDGIDKNIASVFWDFMNSTGVVYVNGEFVTEQLFNNPFYAIGYPKTDAFWAEVKVDNEPRTVLIQCFERRCLTFDPDNPIGWEVESGNIGQHYYHWRYELIDPEDPVVPDGGSFTAEGESEIEIESDEVALLVAEVTSGDTPLPGVVVHFAVAEGSQYVSLDAENRTTNSYGQTWVLVEGESGGIAQVMAYVDLDDSGDFDPDVDLLLGMVEVGVDLPPPPPAPDGGTFSHDGFPVVQMSVGQTVVLSAEVTRNGTPFYGAEVHFYVVEGEHLVIVDQPVNKTDIHGIATVQITALSAGNVTIGAIAPVVEDIDYSPAEDVDLGTVEITILPN